MYYLATVKVKIETDSGAIKNKTFKHLVQDVAISGVEEQITREYNGSVNDWELVSVSETKIVSVLGEVIKA